MPIPYMPGYNMRQDPNSMITPVRGMAMSPDAYASSPQNWAVNQNHIPPGWVDQTINGRTYRVKQSALDDSLANQNAMLESNLSKGRQAEADRLSLISQGGTTPYEVWAAQQMQRNLGNDGSGQGNRLASMVGSSYGGMQNYPQPKFQMKPNQDVNQDYENQLLQMQQSLMGNNALRSLYGR